MSISIYYNFSSEQNFSATGVLDKFNDQWKKECELIDSLSGDDLYESWTWYDPEQEEGLHMHAGATKMPLDERAELYVTKAVELLSALRRDYGGDSWFVNLDDIDIPWNETEKAFVLRN